MKKVIAIFYFLFVTITSSFTQQYFYYYKGEKMFLETSPNKILLKFSDETSENTKRNIIGTIPSLKSNNESGFKKINSYLIIDITEGTPAKQIHSELQNLRTNREVIVANPCLIYKDNTVQGITDQFEVKLKSPSDYRELQRLAKETNTRILKQNQFEPGVYILQADKNSTGNSLEMANFFFETKLFEFSEPDFLLLNMVKTNDTYFNAQWALKNYGQTGGTSGADIEAEPAWELTTGRPDVKIAVVDLGVDLSHPDLINNLLPGYDATGGGSNGGPTGNDAHGTACAGVIAAQDNNGIGVVGIAYDCKIIPIKAGANG